MTLQQKNSIISYFTIANFVVIIGFVWHQAQWQEKTNNKIEYLEEHAKNNVLHMPFEKSARVFVPRVELDGRLNNIQYTLEKIENKLDKIKNK
jgi:hypothetical protein